ncbi:MAG: hypothetical protein HY770_08975, partial [Chitinivibrionia bacterium]|nr:hypothetical protein [Chitinivibrionia bacterium]
MFRKSHRQPIALTSLLSIALLFWLAGCSGDSTPSDGGENDTTPPALVSVTPQDAHHISVVFDEPLDRTSAEYPSNYGIYHQSLPDYPGAARSPQAYGDTLYVMTAALLLDAETVQLTIEPPMQGGEPYQIVVLNVKDLHG